MHAKDAAQPARSRIRPCAEGQSEPLVRAASHLRRSGIFCRAPLRGRRTMGGRFRSAGYALRAAVAPTRSGGATPEVDSRRVAPIVTGSRRPPHPDPLRSRESFRSSAASAGACCPGATDCAERAGLSRLANAAFHVHPPGMGALRWQKQTAPERRFSCSRHRPAAALPQSTRPDGHGLRSARDRPLRDRRPRQR